MANILIVDDEELDRVLISSILETEGHEVSFASQGDVALKVLGEKRIDLVITDLVMPEFNGLRLIREMREREPKARIIAISGAAPEQLDIAEDYGANKTLFKPVSWDKLMEAVNEVLTDPKYMRDDDWY
jgi:CheY-like chemotaxis protein